jgi:iron complex transport system substrate-binding protein
MDFKRFTHRQWRSCRGTVRLALAALVVCASVAGLSAARAGQARAARSGNVTHGCIDRFDAAADYFPDKVTIEDAHIFAVEYRRSFKVVTLREPYPGGPAEKYVLLQCGAPKPALTGDLAGAQIVPVPITSLYASSTTHLPLLVDLGRLDVLTGVYRLSDLIGDEITKYAATGKVREFAAGGVIDPELVVANPPALFMTGGAFSGALATIRSAGVPVVANTEYLEPTALARAEWLKYMAVFLNEERRAQQLYTDMKGRYRALSAKAIATPRNTWPLVMTGRSSKGTFVIAGGKSYVAALIADAGGRYVWADNTASGGPTVEFEAQVGRSADADIWINGGGWKNRAEMLEDEPRYAEFKAYRQNQVWVYERRVTPAGGNDYWSRSVSHPDIVLADLVKIFHPSLLPDHAFEWYIQVPAQ